MLASIPSLTAALLLLSSLTCAAASNAPRAYHTQTGQKSSTSIWQMQTNPTAINMITTSDQGVVNRFTISPSNNSTTQWEFIDAANNTHIQALVVGKSIDLSGVAKGKKVQKNCTLEQPWWQAIPWNLEQMLGASKDQATFIAIRPSDLKCHAFIAKKSAPKTKNQANQQSHVEVRLMGAYNKFWSAQYWFDAQDHRFVKYKAKHGMFAKPTIVQLQELNLSPAAE